MTYDGTNRVARVAFVLGGGGVLGASEVGMLRALLEADVRPDLVLGTSIGAINGAVIAADPSIAAIERLTKLWQELIGDNVLGGSLLSQTRTLIRTKTHLHQADPLRGLLESEFGDLSIDDLTVPFGCVAASIEKATEHWFTDGPLIDAVLASSAVPGLLAPVEIDGEHFMDGGLVNSIPIGWAIELERTRSTCSRSVGSRPAQGADAAMGGRHGRVRDRPTASLHHRNGHLADPRKSSCAAHRQSGQGRWAAAVPLPRFLGCSRSNQIRVRGDPRILRRGIHAAMMRLPRWVRRILSYAALYLLLLLTVITSPLLVLAALVLSHWLPGRWRALRLLGFAIVGLLAESAAIVAAAVLWIASGFGAAISSPRFQRAHYTVLRWMLAVLVGSARRLFQLDLTTDIRSWSPLDDGVPGSTNAMLVLSRHAGPGDSLVLMNTLLTGDHQRRPRVVLKDAMQLDPVCDLYLNRLPAKFVNPNPGPGEDMPSGIAALAEGMGDDDAGVVAALDAAPRADVVFVAHTGLDHMLTIRDIWREIPVHKRLHMRWTFVAAADVPTDRDQRVAWLNAHWSDMDKWIMANNAAISDEAEAE